jgi:hypothetical protein
LLDPVTGTPMKAITGGDGSTFYITGGINA